MSMTTGTIEATLVDAMGSDDTVVNAARVSFGKHSGRFTDAQNHKLIRYLADHKHLSPFGHAFTSFHVKAPLFVARQLVKHKFLRWNEISRRYVDVPPEFYIPDVWRGRAEDKKQGSDGEVEVDEMHLNFLINDTVRLYDHMLKRGVCPEQARMVLPQNMMTEWYWSGSLDAFAAMCKLRCAPDTQYESRVVADQISDKMQELFPVSWTALKGEKPMTDLTKIEQNPKAPALIVPTAVWAVLPPEYKWAAGDADGEVYAHDMQPTRSCLHWDLNERSAQINRLVGVTFDKARWTESLIQRPEGV